MNFFAFAVLFVAVVACARAAEVPATSRLSIEKQGSLTPRVAAAGACNVNICFILGGGRSLTDVELRAQKLFVADLAGVLGVERALTVAATQYGFDVPKNEPRTSDVQSFIDRLLLPTRPIVRREVPVLNAFNYCFSQLPRRGDEVRKIVLFGDGNPIIRTPAIRAADRFRRLGGEVCAGGVESADNDKLLAIAGGDPDKVFDSNSFLDLIEIAGSIDDLAADICKVGM